MISHLRKKRESGRAARIAAEESRDGSHQPSRRMRSGTTTRVQHSSTKGTEPNGTCPAEALATADWPPLPCRILGGVITPSGRRHPRLEAQTPPPPGCKERRVQESTKRSLPLPAPPPSILSDLRSVGDLPVAPPPRVARVPRLNRAVSRHPARPCVAAAEESGARGSAVSVRTSSKQ